MKALQDRFKQGPRVDFHGTYETNDPGSNHKARIKSMALDIWKATGYRFTCVFQYDIILLFRPQRNCSVKDHPQFTNGHKTRFWCSQDESHRSKSSRAARKAQGELYKPRQSSSGETLAKNRFPCRSRLLISSRDSGTHPIVTVRMHHHVAHEPYIDVNLPPEVAQDVYWIAKMGARPVTNGRDGTIDPPRPIHAVQDGDEPALSEENSPQLQETFNDTQPDLPKDLSSSEIHSSTVFIQDHEISPSPHPTTPSEPLQNAHIYHTRMHTHIRNLRTFCDGLEFQLQFNDYRMLETLEREGAGFLDFVGDCLKKEGRLVSTDQDPVPHTPRSPASGQSHMRNGVVSNPDQPIQAPMQIQQPFEANPGVLPGALVR